MSSYDRLTAIALPRIRDFRGVNGNWFDGHGDFTLGLREQLLFPGNRVRTESTRCAAWKSVSSRPHAPMKKGDVMRFWGCHLLTVTCGVEGRRNLMAKKSLIVKAQRTLRSTQAAPGKSLQDLRSRSSLYAEVRHVPHLLPGERIHRSSPRSHQVQLVVAGRPDCAE